MIFCASLCQVIHHSLYSLFASKLFQCAWKMFKFHNFFQYSSNVQLFHQFLCFHPEICWNNKILKKTLSVTFIHSFFFFFFLPFILSSFFLTVFSVFIFLLSDLFSLSTTCLTLFLYCLPSHLSFFLSFFLSFPDFHRFSFFFLFFFVYFFFSFFLSTLNFLFILFFFLLPLLFFRYFFPFLFFLSFSIISCFCFYLFIYLFISFLFFFLVNYHKAWSGLEWVIVWENVSEFRLFFIYFIPLWEILRQILAFRSFLILPRFSFLFLFHLRVSASYIPWYLYLSFSPTILMLSWLDDSVPLFYLFCSQSRIQQACHVM